MASTLSIQLSEAQQLYREEESKAGTAAKFFASAEEHADDELEWLYSGRVSAVFPASSSLSLANSSRLPQRPHSAHDGPEADDAPGAG